MSVPDEMRAAVVPDAGEQFVLEERPVPELAPEEALVAVDACGICHSDEFVVQGTYPGIEYPRVPGHELVGEVVAVGADVVRWDEGDRVGAGWHGGHCFHCEPCERGNFLACERADVTGVTFDGGYAEYAAVPQEALAPVPSSLDAVDAAPLLCAGITTYNALRNADARPGDLVAVQGVGGLGHLGVQYARAAGYETVAVSRSPDKEPLARNLGADHFVDASEEDPAASLTELGGADLILATAPSAAAMESIHGGLGPDGQLVAVGVPEATMSVDVMGLIGKRASVEGWGSGHARDSADTLEFSALREITPEVETFALADVRAAYDRMIDNEARFRVVLEP
jgi:NADPH2:quinone reductase